MRINKFILYLNNRSVKDTITYEVHAQQPLDSCILLSGCWVQSFAIHEQFNYVILNLYVAINDTCSYLNDTLVIK